MSIEKPFRVGFEAAVSGEYDRECSKKRFLQLFQVPESRIDLLFSGKEIIIKTNISEENAMKIAFKILEAGWDCFIEPIPETNDSIGDSDFIERRLNVRRLQDWVNVE